MHPASSPTSAPLPADLGLIPLRSGPLTLEFSDGDLRNVRFGDREVIRRIYIAVRDRDWGTVPMEIGEREIRIEADAFHITYTAIFRQEGIHFVARVAMTGNADGIVQMTFDGEARTTFLRNRIGICVLHPAECAGARCRVERIAGGMAELNFPRWVEPAQPVPGFFDLATLAHEVSPGVWATLRFKGDRFEMEDQRNWIDASFKTYCTPLHLPFPVEISSGTRIQQEITLGMSADGGVLRTPEIPQLRSTVIDVLSRRSKLPAIGLGCNRTREQLDAKDVARLRTLNLHHLRVDVRPYNADWRETLDAARDETAALDIPLELAVHLPANGEAGDLDALVEEITMRSIPLARILLYCRGEKTVSRARVEFGRAHLKSLGVPIGAGTDADFYQLNQARPPHDIADFVHWSMNPQVHAFDDASIAETPTAVTAQLESAQTYFPGKPLTISAITLKPRFNPVATSVKVATSKDELPADVDPRQVSPFAAAWTLSMLKRLAEGGAQSVTFFETIGRQGVMERKQGASSSQFPSRPGQVFPLYYALAAIGSYAGGEVLETVSSDPMRVEAIALAHGRQRCLWLANLTSTRRKVLVRGLAGALRRLDLDWGSSETWMTEPDAFLDREPREIVVETGSGYEVELTGYQFVRLDWIESPG